jgi:maltooligosyltrehalose trehalohydrolase
MTPEGDGYHVHRQPHAEEAAPYALKLADGRDYPDPASRWQPDGVHGPSAVFSPESYRWSDAAWHGIARDELVIYEVHVGTSTPQGTFAAMIPRLPELPALGVTAIELMPVAQFPGDRNWGYDAVYPYAVQNSYGGPRALQQLVDAAHQVGLAVFLDVVYNHLGPEGNYLGNFGPYFTDRYRTPWGMAVNYDGPQSDAVRQFVIDNARTWVRDFHVDGLRLDAVQTIFDLGPRHILAEIQAAVQREAARLGRLVHVIAETDQNDVRLIRPKERGGYGLDGVWNDDFHHSIHALLSGERDGYYLDFGEPAHVAKALSDVFVYDGCYSPFRRRRHGSRVGAIDRTRFVVCVQNHDQVGNRARGDRLGTIVAPAAQRLACGLLLLSPCVPLLFMGEEYGEQRPFPFFCSFDDPVVVEAVRRGRRQEFADLAFQWGTDIPDPQAPETFAAAKLDWTWPEGSPHAQIRRLYQDLLAARRRWPALRDRRHTKARLLAESCHPERSSCHPERSSCHPERSSCHPERSEGSPSDSDEILRCAQDDNRPATDSRPALLVLERGGDDGLLAVANLTAQHESMPRLALDGRKVLLSTEDARYGGSRNSLPAPFGRGAGGEGLGGEECETPQASPTSHAACPHPSPLPKGEGTCEQGASPLPKGEGTCQQTLPQILPHELLIFGRSGGRP